MTPSQLSDKTRRRDPAHLAKHLRPCLRLVQQHRCHRQSTSRNTPAFTRDPDHVSCRHRPPGRSCGRKQTRLSPHAPCSRAAGEHEGGVGDVEPGGTARHIRSKRRFCPAKSGEGKERIVEALRDRERGRERQREREREREREMGEGGEREREREMEDTGIRTSTEGRAYAHREGPHSFSLSISSL